MSVVFKLKNEILFRDLRSIRASFSKVESILVSGGLPEVFVHLDLLIFISNIIINLL